MIYGAAVWDPALIIAQIVSIQCVCYLSLGLLQAVLIGPYVHQLTISFIFDWREIHLKAYVGGMCAVTHIANAALAAVFLVWIVERAKKCLDFASTFYIIHLIVCWSYHGFPSSLIWWATNICGLITMALLGEWLCVRREMQEIPLSSLRNRVSGAGGPEIQTTALSPTATAQTSATARGLRTGTGVDAV